MIASPRRQSNDPDRQVDCEEALERDLLQLMDDAQAAGWTPAEIERAIRRLVAARRRSREETARLEADLALMRAMRSAGE